MNSVEELGEAGVGKCRMSRGRAKPLFSFLISAQNHAAAKSLLGVGFSLAGQPGQEQRDRCADVLPQLLGRGDLQGEFKNNKKKFFLRKKKKVTERGRRQHERVG